MVSSMLLMVRQWVQAKFQTLHKLEEGSINLKLSITIMALPWFTLGGRSSWLPSTMAAGLRKVPFVLILP